LLAYFWRILTRISKCAFGPFGVQIKSDNDSRTSFPDDLLLMGQIKDASGLNKALLLSWSFNGHLPTFFRIVGLHSLCDDAFLLCPTCALGRLQDVYETVGTISANTYLLSLQGPDKLVLPAILVSRMSSIGIIRSFGHFNIPNQTSEQGYAGCLITMTFHLASWKAHRPSVMLFGLYVRTEM
jgi:hypothetical protein